MEYISEKAMRAIVLNKFAMERRDKDIKKIQELLSYCHPFIRNFRELTIEYFWDSKSWREIRETIIMEIDKSYKIEKSVTIK